VQSRTNGLTPSLGSRMEVQYNQKSTKGNSASNAMPAFNITEKILRILKHFYVNHPKKYRKGK